MFPFTHNTFDMPSSRFWGGFIYGLAETLWQQCVCAYSEKIMKTFGDVEYFFPSSLTAAAKETCTDVSMLNVDVERKISSSEVIETFLQSLSNKVYYKNVYIECERDT